jgi:hypothetical protein
VRRGQVQSYSEAEFDRIRTAARAAGHSIDEIAATLAAEGTPPNRTGPTK